MGQQFNFTGQFTTSNPTNNVGYADFLLGDAQQWSTSTQPEHGMRAKNLSFFAQDDIKLRPNLTVNLGVRSETHGGMSEKSKTIWVALIRPSPIQSPTL